MTDLAIDLKHVAKIYRGNVHALQGISMQVRRGEIFGLLGPNGAGKSTLVKIMMTVLRPTRAEGTLLGSPIGHKGTLARVGYLPEHARFPRYLTGRQTLEFFAAMGKVDRGTARRRSAELLQTVGMAAWGDKKIHNYSKGMLQRVGLAQAITNDPDLIVLDEPTDGVDPIGRRDIRDLLLHLRQQGKSIFLNSHLLSELEMICDRVAIMVHGQIVRHGTVDELTRQQQRYEIELDLPDVAAARPQLLAMLAQRGAVMKEKPIVGNASVARHIVDAGELPGGEGIELEGPVIRMYLSDVYRMQPFLDLFRASGYVVRRFAPIRQSLEDLFMQAVIDPASGLSVPPGANAPPPPMTVPLSNDGGSPA